MIPKIIHYCWLGPNKKTDLILKCIDSWHRQMPEFEIKEWNESNFDLSHHKFMAQAYDSGKYAFASDQLRYIVLKEYGGIFLDCDVEALKNFTPLLSNEIFFGIEGHVGKKFTVSPGLIIGSTPNNNLINKMVNEYERLDFIKHNGSLNTYLTSPALLTQQLKRLNFNDDNVEQLLGDNIHIYPTSFFDPIDHTTIKLKISSDFNNAFAVHWGAGSWLTKSAKYRRVLSILLRRLFGNKIINYIRRK